MSACHEMDEDEALLGEPQAPARCRLSVDAAGILRNLEALTAWSPARLIAVVKNNGYGMGLIPYAHLLSAGGVHDFAVARTGEGIALRREAVEGMILLLTPPQDEDEARQIVAYGLSAAVGSLQELNWLERAAFRARATCPIHVKIDTGFGRFGFAPEGMKGVAEALARCPHLTVEGVFSHCGVLEPRQARRQFDRFTAAAQRLETLGIFPQYRHFCSSAMAFSFPEMQLDAIRIGSALLGRVSCRAPVPLTPVGALQAQITAIHTMPAGSRPGYGGAIRLRRDTRVAVVNAGWQDGIGLMRQREVTGLHELLSQAKGLLVQLSRRRSAHWQGQALPILGRGGMNFTLLNATDSDVAVGDWVTMEVNPLLVPGEVHREYMGLPPTEHSFS